MRRVPQVNRSGKEDNTDPIKPVFVSEFPQVVRDEQATSLHARIPGEITVCILSIITTSLHSFAFVIRIPLEFDVFVLCS